MRLHIVIPALNEAGELRELLPYLRQELAGRGTITVADGGSTDASERVVAHCPVARWLDCPRPGRAAQMNAAVALDEPGTYDAFYFVHADTRPPTGFYDDIRRQLQAGYAVGCYRFRFMGGSSMLRINAFCTRFSALSCRGGDQSLFVGEGSWHRLGGFDEDMRIMEDYDIIERVWSAGIPFCIIPRDILVSARKYERNSWLRVQLANLLVFRMYRAGAAQGRMVSIYRRLLR